ncbi:MULTISPECIES: hypothetical protein [unclassified Haladaptatus]|uniref:DUF7521 family protein n=1 Tax=unclassified Haladaptatus TaxID=2622732 RepID=UPI0007B4645B|nr:MULTISPECIES: hypothetical protein [unclassified Haladaptatus]KZN26178.1 hypothetical protein A4G99_22310 [Haladaptatus sp. R4]MCO8246368.1 hypothetical protein [Haladaptatus sp. AB643]MCO8255271.1 hypothetical protein [Haladaptatus sp. AB618]
MNLTILIITLKTLTLLLGGIITFFAFKAYRRTELPALRSLAIGFGVVTLGAFAAGVADQAFSVNQDFALVIESTLTVLGFASIAYSLYAE